MIEVYEEKLIREELLPDSYEFFDKADHSSHLDANVRRWIGLYNSEMFQNLGLNKPAVRDLNTHMFSLEESELIKWNPLNSIFLRFYDCSPTFPFRNIQSQAFFDCYEKVCSL